MAVVNESLVSGGSFNEQKCSLKQALEFSQTIAFFSGWVVLKESWFIGIFCGF